MLKNFMSSIGVKGQDLYCFKTCKWEFNLACQVQPRDKNTLLLICQDSTAGTQTRMVGCCHN